MKVLITGGAGFIGSHAAEFYNNKREEFALKAKKRASYFSWKNLTDCILKVYNGEKADLYSMSRV